MTSSQDSAPQHPISPKPPIPRKPLRLKDSHFPLLTNRHGVTNTLDGKVKQIVDHFKLHENTVAGQNSEEGVQSCKETKTDPSVKPKPSAQCDPLLIQKTAQSQKRESQRHKQKAGSNTIPITSQRGRSAPDGMEVEINNLHKNKMGKGSAAPPSLSCKKGCTCICHLKQPNMRLMWVPMDKEKTEEGKEKEEGQRESEGKEQNKVTCRPLLKENKVKSVPCMTTVEVSPCTLQSNTCLHRSVGNEKEEAIGRVETRKESGGKAAPTVNMPKFQHRSHWYSPISSQASCIQQGPKVIEEAPPPIPPRSSRLTVKSANLHNSSTPPNNQICPPTEYGQLPNALMLHRLPPLLPLKPSQPKPERKALSCQFIPLSKDEEKDDYSEWGKVDMIEEKEAPSLFTQSLSTYMESRLKDEPLYQTYRATVISKVIQHHAVCCKINSTAVEVGALGNYVRPKKSTTQNSLWQELPSVRNSGVLQHLSPAERKRQESMFEVVTSEASYLRSLLVLTDHFLDSRDLNDTLIIHDKRTLFSNILRVREVSERFLRDLEQRVDEGPVISDVCDIIDYHAQHGFSAYIKYIRNQVYQEKIYSSLMQKNVQFATVITRLQGSPLCQRLPFTSFLLLPFQRITRIKMLIENILKRTQEGTKEEQTASKALASVSQIIQDSNSQVGKMRQMEELIQIAQMLEFHKLKAIPIVSQIRFLEKRGGLQEMTKGGTIFGLRPKFTPIYLFLFNDLLIFTYKKSSERYIVTDHAHRSLVQVQAIGEDKRGSEYDHCFCMMLLENHQGCTYERLLKAPTESDMHRWMAAFPNLSAPERDEKVYEDWDCPQVQCVEQYVAQQSDELDLEPTSIINVLRKTNEGWYEGIRLSDGRKGWFPASHVLEITNEHVRRRNVREQYRILRAAAHIGTKEPDQALRTL